MNFQGIFVLVLQVPWGSSRLLGRLERCQRIRKEKDQNGEESSQHHIGPGKGRVTEADTRKLKWEISKTIAFNAEMFLLWDVLGHPNHFLASWFQIKFNSMFCGVRVPGDILPATEMCHMYIAMSMRSLFPLWSK